MIPVAYIASQAGWVLTEVGRQPWAIQNLMPVGIAASKIPAGSVGVTFFLFLALFTALFVAEVSILLRQIRLGPERVESPGPETDFRPASAKGREL